MFKLFFSLYPLISWALLMKFFIAPMRLKPMLNRAIALSTMTVALKFIWFWAFGGDAFVPEIPSSVITVMNLAETALFFYAGFSVSLFIAEFLYSRIFKPILLSNLIRVVLVTICAIAFTVLATRDCFLPPEIIEQKLELTGLPAEFDGYRIVHLSDLHASPSSRSDKISKIVELANSLNPDAVCITGDFYDGQPERRALDLEPLSRLKSQDGVFACTGNHEFYWNYYRMRHVFSSLGIKMLENTHAILQRGNAKMIIGGMNDFAVTNFPLDYASQHFPSLEATFCNAPPGGFRVLLFHRPVLIDDAQHHAVRLQLSGHTHGGCMPVLRTLVKYFNEGHCYGLYRHGNLALYNNPGTGQWSGFPLRLFSRCEITLLVLKRSDEINQKRRKCDTDGV